MDATEIVVLKPGLAPLGFVAFARTVFFHVGQVYLAVSTYEIGLRTGRA
jgi:hypothetical protein